MDRSTYVSKKFPIDRQNYIESLFPSGSDAGLDTRVANAIMKKIDEIIGLGGKA